MCVMGPGGCFPSLTNSVKEAHGLTAFSFVSANKIDHLRILIILVVYIDDTDNSCPK